MSADANVATVRRALRTLTSANRQEVDAFVAELVHADCEWQPFLSGVEGRTYRGPEGLREFANDLLGSFDVSYDVDEVRPIGDDAVLLLATMNLRGQGSDVAVRQELGVLWEFENGLIRRGKAMDHRQAKAAAEAQGA